MKHCLVIDDSSMVRRVARRFLEELGVFPLEAEGSAEALAICGQGVPELVILDWQLPTADSLELMAKLRQMPGGSSAIMFYLTTEIDPVDLSRAFTSGADDYMLKPFDRTMFMSKLSTLARAA